MKTHGILRSLTRSCVVLATAFALFAVALIPAFATPPVPEDYADLSLHPEGGPLENGGEFVISGSVSAQVDVESFSYEAEGFTVTEEPVFVRESLGGGYMTLTVRHTAYFQEPVLNLSMTLTDGRVFERQLYGYLGAEGGEPHLFLSTYREGAYSKYLSYMEEKGYDFERSLVTSSFLATEPDHRITTSEEYLTTPFKKSMDLGQLRMILIGSGVALVAVVAVVVLLLIRSHSSGKRKGNPQGPAPTPAEGGGTV